LCVYVDTYLLTLAVLQVTRPRFLGGADLEVLFAVFGNEAGAVGDGKRLVLRWDDSAPLISADLAITREKAARDRNIRVETEVLITVCLIMMSALVRSSI